MKFTDLMEGIYSISIVIIRKNYGNSERKINFLTEKLIVLTLSSFHVAQQISGQAEDASLWKPLS